MIMVASCRYLIGWKWRMGQLWELSKEEGFSVYEVLLCVQAIQVLKFPTHPNLLVENKESDSYENSIKIKDFLSMKCVFFAYKQSTFSNFHLIFLPL